MKNVDGVYKLIMLGAAILAPFIFLLMRIDNARSDLQAQIITLGSKIDIATGELKRMSALEDAGLLSPAVDKNGSSPDSYTK